MEGRLDWFMEDDWNTQQRVCLWHDLSNDWTHIICLFLPLMFVASPYERFAFLSTQPESRIVCLLCKYMWEWERGCACVDVCEYVCAQLQSMSNWKGRLIYPPKKKAVYKGRETIWSKWKITVRTVVVALLKEDRALVLFFFHWYWISFDLIFWASCIWPPMQ